MTAHCAPSRPDADWRRASGPKRSPDRPDLAPMIASFVSRRGQDAAGLETRLLWLLDVALLVACRATPDLVASHVEAALEAGTRRGEIVEAIVEAALYAGMPAGEAGMQAALSVFARMDRDAVAA